MVCSLSENGVQWKFTELVLCDVSILGSKNNLVFELILWANFFTIVLSWVNHDRRIMMSES